MNTANLDANLRQLLSTAAEWRLLGLLFELPRADWKAQLSSIAAEVGAEDLHAAAAAALKDGSEGLYHASFMPSGPVSPREITYRKTMTPGQFISELNAFYKAFAYQPALAEAEDHVAVQVGFIAYLRLKQAYAISRGEAEQALTCAEAAERFTREHLQLLTEPLAQQLQGSGAPYLNLTAAALLRRVGVAQPVASICG